MSRGWTWRKSGTSSLGGFGLAELRPGHRRIIFVQKLEKSTKQIFNLLFSMPAINYWCHRGHILAFCVRLPSPHYYKHSVPSLSNPADCIRMVLENTRYHPKSLEIVVCFFYERFLSDKSSPWHKGGEYHQLLVEYLSEVCHLTLDTVCKESWKVKKKFPAVWRRTREKVCSCKDIVPFIMRVLSSKGQLHLKELTIYRARECFESIVYAISPYLKRSEALSDHNNLESFSIHFGQQYSRHISRYSNAAVLELAEIIESQTSLFRLQLDCNSPFTGVDFSLGLKASRLCTGVDFSLGLKASRLCTALAGLVRQPQFCEMNLGMSIPSGGFQEMIHSFITTPRSEDCSLSFQGHVDDNYSLLRDISCLSPPQDNILHKTLTLMFGRPLPDSVLQWLRECVVLRLKELCINLPSTVPSLLKHPQMEVNQLTLKCHQYNEYSTPLTDEFGHILQNIHLKHLAIELCMIDIPSLVHALHKQAELGSLETLKFIDGCRYRDGAVVTPLFDAIVSLPQLENFTLNVGFHCPDCHMILYNQWKEKAGGKRFKRLVYRFTGSQLPPEDLSLLQNIAHDFECMPIVCYNWGNSSS